MTSGNHASNPLTLRFDRRPSALGSLLRAFLTFSRARWGEPPKGPVYYERALTLLGARHGDQCRFDLHSEGEHRPCIPRQIGAVS